MNEIQKAADVARLTFPNAKTDLEAMFLTNSCLDRYRAERLAALALNASQAQTIAGLSLKLAVVSKELDALRKERV